jgi:hypothetical protein
MSSIVIWDRSFLADTGAALVDKDGANSKAGRVAYLSNPNAGSGREPFVNVVSSLTQSPLGLFIEVNLDGRSVSVRLLGEAFGVIGASVVAGNDLKWDVNGRLIPSVSGDKVIGQALESLTLPATPTGSETVNVLLRGPYVKP